MFPITVIAALAAGALAQTATTESSTNIHTTFSDAKPTTTIKAVLPHEFGDMGLAGSIVNAEFCGETTIAVEGCKDQHGRKCAELSHSYNIKSPKGTLMLESKAVVLEFDETQSGSLGAPGTMLHTTMSCELKPGKHRKTLKEAKCHSGGKDSTHRETREWKDKGTKYKHDRIPYRTIDITAGASKLYPNTACADPQLAVSTGVLDVKKVMVPLGVIARAGALA